MLALLSAEAGVVRRDDYKSRIKKSLDDELGGAFRVRDLDWSRRD
jgi:hypothetical protein